MTSTMPPKKCQIKYQLQVRIEKFLKFMERQCKRHCKKSGFEKYRFRPEDDYPDTFQEQIYHIFPQNPASFSVEILVLSVTCDFICKKAIHPNIPHVIREIYHMGGVLPWVIDTAEDYPLYA